MSILMYLDENINENENNLVEKDEQVEEKELTPTQLSKKKYMKKYQQTDAYKEPHKILCRSYYKQHSKEIYEQKKKRWLENPEIYEKQKEKNRLYQQKRNAMLKNKNL